MDVSIIISTWNNAEIVKRTLHEFEKCVPVTDIDWEIVVVNNNSTDNTADVVKNFTGKLPLKYVEEPQQGLSKARNKGLKNATGELIIFTDDDVFPVADWIMNYWKVYCAHKENYYFGGSIYSVYEDESQVDKELLKWAPPSVKGLDWGDTQHVLRKDEFFVSANWACNRQLLLDAGGFDESLGLGSKKDKIVTSEETALMEKLSANGLKALYLPNVLIGHYVPISKCQFSHIMGRRRASGEASAKLYYSYENESLLFGVPRWMIKKTIKLWLNYLCQKFLLRAAYKEYFHFIFWVGYIEGVKSKRLKKL